MMFRYIDKTYRNVHICVSKGNCALRTSCHTGCRSTHHLAPSLSVVQDLPLPSSQRHFQFSPPFSVEQEK